MLLIFMTLLVTIDVVWDIVFNQPIHNVVEIVSVYFMVALVFFPMGEVEQKDEHIGADVLVQYLGEKHQAILKIVTYSISLAFVLILFSQTLDDAIKAMHTNEKIMGSSLIVIWPSRFSLPIGFGLLALAMLAKILDAVTWLIQSRKNSESRGQV